MNVGFKNDFTLISHRGASFYEPENTISSFQRAVDLGSGIIEFDVRKTLDNELVVIHDSKLDRTTNGKGLVRSKTLYEIKKLDAGKGQTVPAVSEVFESFKGKVNFVVELKEENTEEQILELIHKFNISNEVILVSFKKKVLKRLSTIDRFIKTGLITLFGYNCAQTALSLGCSAVATNNMFVTVNKIRKAHDNKLLFYCWTVNNKQRCLTLKNMGVDGVITNIPDLVY